MKFSNSIDLVSNLNNVYVMSDRPNTTFKVISFWLRVAFGMILSQMFYRSDLKIDIKTFSSVKECAAYNSSKFKYALTRCSEFPSY